MLRIDMSGWEIRSMQSEKEMSEDAKKSLKHVMASLLEIGKELSDEAYTTVTAVKRIMRP